MKLPEPNTVRQRIRSSGNAFGDDRKKDAPGGWAGLRRGSFRAFHWAHGKHMQTLDIRLTDTYITYTHDKSSLLKSIVGSIETDPLWATHVGSLLGYLEALQIAEWIGRLELTHLGSQSFSPRVFYAGQLAPHAPVFPFVGAFYFLLGEMKNVVTVKYSTLHCTT